MTDEEEIAVTKKLPKGSRKALLLMSDQWQLPGRHTFNANAAFNLSWMLRSYGGLAERKYMGGRAAYRITPLGQRIKDRLPPAPVGRNPKGHDPQGHGAKHEHAVPAGERAGAQDSGGSA